MSQVLKSVQSDLSVELFLFPSTLFISLTFSPLNSVELSKELLDGKDPKLDLELLEPVDVKLGLTTWNLPGWHTKSFT